MYLRRKRQSVISEEISSGVLKDEVAGFYLIQLKDPNDHYID